ncbi:hypothetical protein MY11210_002659 [Beauveria gryllotalpidicola]
MYLGVGRRHFLVSFEKKPICASLLGKPCLH